MIIAVFVLKSVDEQCHKVLLFRSDAGEDNHTQLSHHKALEKQIQSKCVLKSIKKQYIKAATIKVTSHFLQEIIDARK